MSLRGRFLDSLAIPQLPDSASDYRPFAFQQCTEDVRLGKGGFPGLEEFPASGFPKEWATGIMTGTDKCGWHARCPRDLQTKG